jgi:anti-sigma factor RsiW
MELKNLEENLLTRYLLGDLTEDETAQIEERFFADDEVYERLRVAEDELIYHYLQGGLSPHERRLFDAQLAASPKRREKVRFVKDLMEAASQASATAIVEASIPETKTARSTEGVSFWQRWLAFLTGRDAVWQLAMAAAMLAIALGGLWMWRQNRNLNAALEAAKTSQRDSEQRSLEEKRKTDDLQKQKDELAGTLKQEQAARAELEKEKQQWISRSDNPTNPPGLILPFTLEPGLSRSDSEEPKALSLPRRVSQITLTLALGSDDGSGRYRAELSSRGGTLLWSLNDLSARQKAWGKAVVVNLPAAILRNSEYDLTVKRVIGKGAFEDVGYYYFKIVKQIN